MHVSLCKGIRILRVKNLFLFVDFVCLLFFCVFFLFVVFILLCFMGNTVSIVVFGCVLFWV